MIKRSEKLAFMEVGTGENRVYKRMTGFTEFSLSQNPKEYSRKYVDEDMERVEVVSYSPSISYKFDADMDNPVHKFLYDVAERELTGEDAKCSIIIVDISKDKESGQGSAVLRSFSVIPNSEGEDKDTYTVSGTLKALGKKEFGVATSRDNWQTLTIEA